MSNSRDFNEEELYTIKDAVMVVHGYISNEEPIKTILGIIESKLSFINSVNDQFKEEAN